MQDAISEQLDPSAEYAARRNRLRREIRKAGLDCLLVLEPADRFYLSGFELSDTQPDESSGCLIIASDGNDWLATDSRYRLAAERLWDPERLLIYRGEGLDELAGLLKGSGILIGTSARGISWRKAQALGQKLGRHHRLLPSPPFVARMREIKSAQEIAALRRSFRLNHAMFDWLGERVKSGELPGLSETALAWEIEKFFRENGAEELAFATIAAVGVNAAIPHATPSADVKIADGPLLVDAGCRVEGYCSDQTRTWWLGPEPAREFSAALSLVRDAQQAALEIMRPGVACSKVYDAACKVFEKAGALAAFTHGLGHGVGLQTHEAPSLSRASTQILREGMTVTVEPGLYYPEWGGVRWENTVLVDKDGITIL